MTSIKSEIYIEIPRMKKEKNDKLNKDYMIKSLIAGGISGCAAKTAIAPLDRIKILFQTNSPSVIHHAGSIKGITAAMKDIYLLRGITGLYQGHSATILRIFPYAAVKFMAFEQYKGLISPYFEKGSAKSYFIAGSMAGVTSVAFTYPLDTLRARMAYEVNNPGGFSYTARKIYTEAPVIRIFSLRLINFYRGFIPTLLGMIPYAGVSFWAHQKILNIFRNQFGEYTLVNPNIKTKKGIKWWAELISGAIAGLTAQTASYPLEVIRRRIQISSADISSPNTSILSTAKNIWLTKGFPGFYIGLSVGYIKVAPLVSISFFTYAKMKQFLNID